VLLSWQHTVWKKLSHYALKLGFSLTGNSCAMDLHSSWRRNMVTGIRSHSKRMLTEGKKLLERYKLGLEMHNYCRLPQKMSMLLLSSRTKDSLWTKHSNTSRINWLHHDRLLRTSKLFRAHSLLFSFISHNSKKIENSLGDKIILRIPKLCSLYFHFLYEWNLTKFF